MVLWNFRQNSLHARGIHPMPDTVVQPAVREMLQIGVTPLKFSNDCTPVITIIQIYDPRHTQPVSLNAASDSTGKNGISMNSITEYPLLEGNAHPLQLRVAVYSWEVHTPGISSLKRKDFANLPLSYPHKEGLPADTLLSVSHME